MEKAATFHTPLTSPTPAATFSNTTNAAAATTTTEGRKRRSHTVSLPRRLPFHRHTKTNSKPSLPSPHAPPSLPLPSLPFRRHAATTDQRQASDPTSTPGPDPAPTAAADLTRRRRRLNGYPSNISLLPPTPATAITPSLAARERTRNAARASSLAGSLTRLDERAHASTRRLDDVYYGLLARRAQLGELVGRLRGLHETVRRGREEFGVRAAGLEREGAGVVEGWDGFATRKGEVEGLVGRLGRARERGRRVEERLAGLRGRVEGWEREEVERGRGRVWWARVVVWVLVGVVSAVLVGMVWRGVPGGFDGVDEWGSGWDGGGMARDGKKVGVRLGTDEEWRRKEWERGRRWENVLGEL